MSEAPVIRLAVTLGDPRGIGPEVTFGALRELLDEAPDVTIRLLGADGLEAHFEGLEGGSRIDFEGVGRFDGSARSAGEISIAALRRGVDLCMDGRATALVTGPVHKPSLHAAGANFPGQTEFLQSITAARAVGMLMASETSRLDAPLRILLATTHLPLRSVPGALTAARLEEQTALLAEALTRGWGIESPTLALCALNPHASDQGLFGDEEERVMAPAVRRIRDRGIRMEGPIPADTVFLRLGSGESDAVVVPYHDVGMAVFKTLAFGAGVNTTLGLPFLRTSPDHGTAFEIAGTGRADPGSMLEALRLAVRIGPGLSRASPPGFAPK